MRRDSRLVVAALEAQEDERASGFAVANPPLSALLALGPDDLLPLVRELQRGETGERELSARLLSHTSIPAATVVELARSLVDQETDPRVVRWLVAAFQHAGSPAAIADLDELSRHPDPRVRFGVPDALSSCARDLAEVAATLLRLSLDSDRDVRWSAAFEMASWLEDSSSVTAHAEVVARLRELGTSDPDPQIRAVAAQALAGCGGYS